jgi:hypothetical protein
MSQGKLCCVVTCVFRHVTTHNPITTYSAGVVRGVEMPLAPRLVYGKNYVTGHNDKLESTRTQNG